MSTVLATFRREVAESIAPRTVVLVIGTLLLQLGFIASYVGAFHDPQGHDVRVGIVASQATAEGLMAKLESQEKGAVEASVVSTRALAAQQVKDGDLTAAIVIDESGTQDELIVASGGGTSLVTVVEAATQQLAAEQDRTLTVTDEVPLQAGDARGLSGFYLAIGWIIGGYLMAALLGVARGAQPANAHRAAIRLLAAIPYAAVAGLGGALIVDQWLGALTGHFWSLWGLGAVLVFAAAAVTTALQVLAGTFGIGLTVLLFVVIGNPSAGGAFQWDLMPTFWRNLGPWLPNGAATEAIRRIVYFDGTQVGRHLLVITAYALVGVLVTMLAARRLASREAEPASAAEQ